MEGFTQKWLLIQRTLIIWLKGAESL